MFEAAERKFGQLNWWPGDTPLEISVGAILTQNTNWGNVEKAIAALKKAGVMNAAALHGMPVERLAVLIRPAGYYNIKAARLKNFLKFLHDNYGGQLENMRENNLPVLRRELLSVNGIGPETADSILLYALEKPVFVIDAYTMRILKRHGLTSEAGSYHGLQSLFYNCLEPDVKIFNQFHAFFVMLGKEYCRPKPQCEGCPLVDLSGAPAQPGRA
ncbi:MAG: endonuclease III domain-containing protein [Nitrospira sp.]|nr:endonuclease III domain-containing protein [bacterium]MBL7048775.1 endonuclease III domain-containing protein [Nitrospira sp.]